jgi:kinesin family protein 15
LNAQVAELQAKKIALELELDHRVATQIQLEDECPKLKAQIAVLEKKVEAMRSLELRLGMLEEELNAKEDAIESLEKQHLAAAQQKETLLENAEQNLITMKSDRDRVCTELQSLHEELLTLQSQADYHEVAALEAQKNAELNERCLKEKEEESRLLQTSVEALQSTLSALENQLDLLKRESEQQRMMREDLELDLEGMRNHMSMMHALRSTDAWNAQSFQTAQSTNAELQRQLDEKDKELEQVRKKLESLHCQCDDYTRKIEDMEADLTHVQQEILALRIECEHKDKQISTLNVQLADAESLTQDVMRDLHSVKLDISNYASLVSQQQLELISERARHFDEAQEKDEEVSNLRAQLNKERESWMLEMHHKQAEIVVSRVLSEKLLLKNKTLANEYKKLKADHAGKRKQLQLLEEELKQLTELQSCTESETEDFDEVKQFQALLACANANDELPQNQA